MNHQIYGILLFASILLLIYLLNKNYTERNQDVIYNVNMTEGFDSSPTPNPILDNYIEYDNAYFDIENEPEMKNRTLEDVLRECDKNYNCYGITKLKNSKNDDNTSFFNIININSCKTKYQGSDLEKELSKNYVSYIKKSVPNADKLCLNLNNNLKKDLNLNNISSIYGYNDLVWTVKNNKIELITPSLIDVNNYYNLCKFKIVEGLYGKNTISIKYEIDGFPTQYVVNEYPKKNYLFLREVKNNELEWKKYASYKMVDGLSKEGFSLKILGFPDIYIVANGNTPNLLSIVIVELTDDDTKTLGTFFVKPELTKEINDENSSDYSKKLNDTSNNINLSIEEKTKKMKSKNLYTLEKQAAMLENQMNMINSFDFIHKNNISNIGREFANQSANLALSKYLKEQENIKLAGDNWNSILANGSNMPSVSKFKNSF